MVGNRGAKNSAQQRTRVLKETGSACRSDASVFVVLMAVGRKCALFDERFVYWMDFQRKTGTLTTPFRSGIRLTTWTEFLNSQISHINAHALYYNYKFALGVNWISLVFNARGHCIFWLDSTSHLLWTARDGL